MNITDALAINAAFEHQRCDHPGKVRVARQVIDEHAKALVAGELTPRQSATDEIIGRQSLVIAAARATVEEIDDIIDIWDDADPNQNGYRIKIRKQIDELRKILAKASSV